MREVYDEMKGVKVLFENKCILFYNLLIMDVVVRSVLIINYAYHGDQGIHEINS